MSVHVYALLVYICVLIFTKQIGGLTLVPVPGIPSQPRVLPWSTLSPVCTRVCVFAAEGAPLVLSNPKVQGRSCGALHVRAFSAVTRPSFLDYLRSGAEIGFMVAGVSLKGGGGSAWM